VPEPTPLPYLVNATAAADTLYWPDGYTVNAEITGVNAARYTIEYTGLAAANAATCAAINAAVVKYIINVQTTAATTTWTNAGTGNGWLVDATANNATWAIYDAAIVGPHTPPRYTVPARPRTPQEVEADRVRIAAVREAEDTARARAEELLNRYLREDQRATLKERGWFQVEARSGTRYRIYRGRSHNVKVLDAQDREVASLCAHPQAVVPDADCMLSQKLMLELSEDRFLSIANRRELMSNVMGGRRIAA
jgi:hypothetical protein